MKLLLSALLLGIAVATSHGSYAGYAGDYSAKADAEIKKLQLDTSDISKQLGNYEKIVEQQLRDLAIKAAKLRAQTDKLIRKVVPRTTTATESSTTSATETSATSVTETTTSATETSTSTMPQPPMTSTTLQPSMTTTTPPTDIPYLPCDPSDPATTCPSGTCQSAFDCVYQTSTGGITDVLAGVCVPTALNLGSGAPCMCNNDCSSGLMCIENAAGTMRTCS